MQIKKNSSQSRKLYALLDRVTFFCFFFRYLKTRSDIFIDFLLDRLIYSFEVFLLKSVEESIFFILFSPLPHYN